MYQASSDVREVGRRRGELKALKMYQASIDVKGR
jgi:hypothetical protein